MVAGSNPVHPTKKGTSASTKVEADVFEEREKQARLNFRATKNNSKPLIGEDEMNVVNHSCEAKWLMFYAFVTRVLRMAEQSDANPQYKCWELNPTIFLKFSYTKSYICI